MAEACHTCRFWIADETYGDPGLPVMGECRFNPPVLSDHLAHYAFGAVRFGGHETDPEDIAGTAEIHNACLWPVSSRDAWCGRHEPAPPSIPL